MKEIEEYLDDCVENNYHRMEVLVLGRDTFDTLRASIILDSSKSLSCLRDNVIFLDDMIYVRDHRIASGITGYERPF